MSTKKAKPEMTNETVTKATEQVAEQVASFAQKTLDQAQGAFEKVSEVAHGNVQLMDAAANAYKNRVTDIQLKSMEFVQLNINSGFAFARKFFAVRDPSEVMNLHQNFLKEQAETLQRQAELAAPSLGLPVAAYGTGAGATVGVLRAFSGETWAFAVGASVEKRNEYSPVALALATSTFSTSVTPGTAVHVTAGLDRLVGSARWSTVVITDVYSEDAVSANENGVITPQVAYTLGPQITASTQLDFANAGWRERSLSVSARRRSAFSDSSGAAVTGSDGTYLDGAFNDLCVDLSPGAQSGPVMAEIDRLLANVEHRAHRLGKSLGISDRRALRPRRPNQWPDLHRLCRAVPGAHARAR